MMFVKSDGARADLARVRLTVLLGSVALLAAPLPALAASAKTDHEAWAKGAISVVTREKIFKGSPATFRPADPLTQGTLAGALTQLGSPTSKPADPAVPVTIAQLDASIVDALGLRGAAYEFYRGANQAGLRPPARFGTEVVARLLGLRTDLPVADDAFELQPQQTATRADAAFSAARVLSLGTEGTAARGQGGLDPAPSPLATAENGDGVQYVKQLAATFALPALDAWQRRVIQTAVSFIGYPYVWGGENEQTDHGFDCSGFVWRVFKLQAYPGAPALANVFQGRTAADMAFEVPRKERIHRADLEPGDVLFFGTGPRSTPKTLDHAAIYIGNGWLIHSSGQGVALAPLDWNDRGFAWARRPLAEAGLEPAATAA
jgi:cell wall-associated NlpC family hydrolase